ncbi:MAG: hypothetical protein AB2A00_00115 [Myxococcota bacterium]
MARALRLTSTDALAWVLSRMALGLGAVSLVVALLAAVGEFHVVAMWLVFLAGVVAAVILGAGRQLRGAADELRAMWKACPVGLRLWGVGTAVLMGMTLVAAMAPPSSADALSYHLEIPRQMLLTGRLAFLPWTFASFYPQGTEMLMAFASALGGPTGATQMVAVLGIPVAVLLLVTGRMWGGASAGVAAVCLVLGTPMAVWELSGAFNDYAGMVWMGAACLPLMNPERETTDAELRATGLLAGFCAASKLSGFIPAAICGVVAALAVGRRRGASQALVAFLGVGLYALLVAMPWYARSVYFTGSPAYPMAPEVFGAPNIPPRLLQWLHEHLWASYGHGRDLWHILTAPLDLVVRGEAFDRGQALGPLVWALLPLGVWKLRRHAARPLLAVAAFFLVWAALMPQARYVLPIWWAAAGIAAVGASVLREHRVATSVAGVTAASLLLLGGAYAARFLPVALGLEDRVAFLEQRVLLFREMQELRRRVGPEARVLVGGIAHYWMPGPYEGCLADDGVDCEQPDKRVAEQRGLAGLLIPDGPLARREFADDPRWRVEPLVADVPGQRSGVAPGGKLAMLMILRVDDVAVAVPQQHPGAVVGAP